MGGTPNQTRWRGEKRVSARHFGCVPTHARACIERDVRGAATYVDRRSGAVVPKGVPADDGLLVVRCAGALRAFLPRFAGPLFERSGEEELHGGERDVGDVVVGVARDGGDERGVVEGEPAPEHTEGSNGGALRGAGMRAGAMIVMHMEGGGQGSAGGGTG